MEMRAWILYGTAAAHKKSNHMNLCGLDPWMFFEHRTRYPYRTHFNSYGCKGPKRTPTPSWADLGGLIFTIYRFICLRPAPKTRSTHEWDLELVSGADFWRNLHYSSSRSPSQGSRGPPWAPRGRQSARNPGPDLSFYPPQGLPSQ